MLRRTGVNLHRQAGVNLNRQPGVNFVVFCTCSSEDENPKLVEKGVTIEVEMDGNYDDYLVTFSVHSMLSGTSTFVSPVLDQPTELNWTQVIEQGNTYTLSFEPYPPEQSRL